MQGDLIQQDGLLTVLKLPPFFPELLLEPLQELLVAARLAKTLAVVYDLLLNSLKFSLQVFQPFFHTLDAGPMEHEFGNGNLHPLPVIEFSAQGV
jgi:hypothetical protein